MWNRARLVFESRAMPWNADAILHVPSRSTLSFEIAAKLSAWSGLPHVEEVFLRKRRTLEVLAAAHEVPHSAIPRQIRGDFFRQLDILARADPHSTFQMKAVRKMHVRKLLAPWEPIRDASSPSGLSVVLADDLMGSGASLESFAGAMADAGARVVGGICLLSDRSRF